MQTHTQPLNLPRSASQTLTPRSRVLSQYFPSDPKHAGQQPPGLYRRAGQRGREIPKYSRLSESHTTPQPPLQGKLFKVHWDAPSRTLLGRTFLLTSGPDLFRAGSAPSPVPALSFIAYISSSPSLMFTPWIYLYRAISSAPSLPFARLNKPGSPSSLCLHSLSLSLAIPLPASPCPAPSPPLHPAKLMNKLTVLIGAGGWAEREALP